MDVSDTEAWELFQLELGNEAIRVSWQEFWNQAGSWARADVLNQSHVVDVLANNLMEVGKVIDAACRLEWDSLPTDVRKCIEAEFGRPLKYTEQGYVKRL